MRMMFVLAFTVFGLLSYNVIEQLTGADVSEYVEIEVTEGDSLWDYANEFEEYHNLSNNKFISWVEEENELSGKWIKPGQKLFLPVKKEDVVGSDLQVVLK